MIEWERATEEMEAVVAKFGEGYRYPGVEEASCKYVKGGEPSCLVGQVLARIGVDVEDLIELDELVDQRIGRIIDSGVLGAEVPKSVKYGLMTAQEKQDQGYTWGEALFAYKGVVKNGD